MIATSATKQDLQTKRVYFDSFDSHTGEASGWMHTEFNVTVYRHVLPEAATGVAVPKLLPSLSNSVSNADLSNESATLPETVMLQAS